MGTKTRTEDAQVTEWTHRCANYCVGYDQTDQYVVLSRSALSERVSCPRSFVHNPRQCPRAVLTRDTAKHSFYSTVLCTCLASMCTARQSGAQYGIQYVLLVCDTPFRHPKLNRDPPLRSLHVRTGGCRVEPNDQGHTVPLITRGTNQSSTAAMCVRARASDVKLRGGLVLRLYESPGPPAAVWRVGVPSRRALLGRSAAGTRVCRPCGCSG